MLDYNTTDKRQRIGSPGSRSLGEHKLCLHRGDLLPKSAPRGLPESTERISSVQPAPVRTRSSSQCFPKWVRCSHWCRITGRKTLTSKRPPERPSGSTGTISRLSRATTRTEGEWHILEGGSAGPQLVRSGTSKDTSRMRRQP